MERIDTNFIVVLNEAKNDIAKNETSRKAHGLRDVFLFTAHYLLSYHRQQHLESLRCFQCMWIIGRHDDGIACLQLERFSRDAYLRFPFQHVYERIEWSGVFAKFLILVEGKECDVTGIGFGDLPADDGTLLVRDQFRHVQDF